LRSLESERARRMTQRRSEGPKVDVSALDLKLHTGLNDRAWFCAIVAVEVLANMVALGLETDYMCRHNCRDAEFGPWLTLDKLFAALAVLDVAAVMISLRPRVFFRGHRFKVRKLPIHAFRTLDFLVVCIRAVDSFFITSPRSATGLKYLSLARVTHIARFANKVQLIGAFRELWLILAGMADTMRTVGWVMALLVGAMWLFAIILTIAVNDGGKVYDYALADWTQDDYWGNMPRSLFTLCQVLTRDNWSRRLAWPLVDANAWMFLIFVSFLSIALLAILNTIVGVIVESTLRSARSNEDKAARERQKIDHKIMANLQQVFMDADFDGNGLLEKKEMHAALKLPRVKRAVQILGLPANDLDLLFNLLDDEGLGKIQTDQFFRGCSRLRGPAMARDLQHMATDIMRHSATASDHIEAMRHVNDGIASVLDILDTIEVDIMQDEADTADPVLMARRVRERSSRARFIRRVDTDRNSSAVARSSSRSSTSRRGRLGSMRVSGRMTDVKTTQSQLPAKPPSALAKPGKPLAPPPPLPPHLADAARAIEDADGEESAAPIAVRRFGEPPPQLPPVEVPVRRFGNRPSLNQLADASPARTVSPPRIANG